MSGTCSWLGLSTAVVRSVAAHSAKRSARLITLCNVRPILWRCGVQCYRLTSSRERNMPVAHTKYCACQANTINFCLINHTRHRVATCKQNVLT